MASAAQADAVEVTVADTAEKAVDAAVDVIEEKAVEIPGTIPAILDPLADYIYDAIKIEDGLFCARVTKCRDEVCRSRLVHDQHIDEMAPCSERWCQYASVFASHAKGCSATVCPFCVRVKQRRLLCKLRWLEYLTAQSRRQLRDLLARSDISNPQAVFVRGVIAVNERKKEASTAELEDLNRLVVEHRLPIFNFPVFMWHIEDPVVIKLEQAAAAAEATATTAPVPTSTTKDMQTTAVDSASESRELMQLGVHYQQHADRAVISTDSNATIPAEDHIARLVSAASADDSSEGARTTLEEAIKLAFNIVDASYCSPMKASRCLLSCQTILVHLQHHVDLQVCRAPLCQQVEFHFAHLSACSAGSTHQHCEYCLPRCVMRLSVWVCSSTDSVPVLMASPVSEYEYARAIEFMEAEQLEAKAKVQSLVSAITRSLHSDPVNEREQNVMQLDDELQQTEEHARVLMEKLSRTAGKLRRVRRRIQSHPRGITSIGHQTLPRHFIKQRKTSSS
ncbi:hypothetical protein PINS_up008052 [Pythium insidiosum]|nr:hypothetical protein PINS_up008052 [Pythium insidiosum]